MKAILHIVLPLAIGTWIYLAFRSESLLAIQWLEQLGDAVRAEATIPHFILYCLPDGLWVYAGTAWMLMIWEKTNAWVLSFAVVMVAAEFGQLAGLVPGTYDPLDIVATVFAFTIAMHFHYLRVTRSQQTPPSEDDLLDEIALRLDLRHDEGFRAGMKAGWNMGDAGKTAIFESAVAGLTREIHEARRALKAE